MTFRQIGVGSAIGLSMTALAVAGVLPQPFEPLGLVVVIGSMVIGGADGTLPRMR
jgi:hypothetical protein